MLRNGLNHVYQVYDVKLCVFYLLYEIYSVYYLDSCSLEFYFYFLFLVKDYRKKHPEVTVLDPPNAIQHLHNRQSMLQDVADLNLSDYHGKICQTINCGKLLFLSQNFFKWLQIIIENQLFRVSDYSFALFLTLLQARLVFLGNWLSQRIHHLYLMKLLKLV